MKPNNRSIPDLETQITEFRKKYNDSEFLLKLADFAFHLDQEARELPQLCNDGLIRSFDTHSKIIENGYGYLWHVYFLSAILKHLLWIFQDQAKTSRSGEWYEKHISELTRGEVLIIIKSYGLMTSPGTLQDEEIDFTKNLAKWIMYWFLEQDTSPLIEKSPEKNEEEVDHCQYLQRGIDLKEILESHKIDEAWKTSLPEEEEDGIGL